MDKGTNKKNNQGFSLIELIVVIAIIAIVAGISTYSFNNVTTHRVKTFVNECDALLSQCKIETMSGAHDVSFIITKDDSKWIAILNKNGSTIERPASKSKNFKCEITISGEPYPIEIEYLDLTFDRTTGRIESVYYREHIYGRTIDAIGCTKITVSNAVGEKSIVLIPQTGHHEVQ